MAAAQPTTISSPLLPIRSPANILLPLLRRCWHRCPPPRCLTGCYGSDPSQFLMSNRFAAAGEGWDIGAACGRQYLVRCISSSRTGVYFPGQTVQIRIVDYAMASSSAAAYKQSAVGATLVLSQTAFGSIANTSEGRVPTVRMKTN